MEKKVKKILIGFFIMMFLLTIVSRAAASVIVAKVKVDQVKRNNLTYTLIGAGVVKGNAQKYIELKAGYKMGRVNVKVGDSVQKGDLLFQYDLKSLTKKKKNLLEEYEKLVLQYEKSSLYTKTADGIDPINNANLSIENAKEDIENAKEEMEDIKNTVYQNKNKEYETSEADLEVLKASKEEALVTAERNIADIQMDLDSINKPILQLEEYLANYKAAILIKKEDQIVSAYNQLFDLYYDGTYDEHVQKVTEAKKSLDRSKEDLEDIKNKWNRLMNPWDQYSEDESVVKSYYEQISQKQEEVKNGNRTIADAQETYDQLTKKDTELDNLIQNYRGEIEKNNVQDYTYQLLYQTIYKKLKLDQDKVKLYEEKLNRAKEDKENTTKSWDIKIKNVNQKLIKLGDDIKNMEDGTYDYSNDIKDAKKTLQDAKRDLKTAKLQLQEAKSAKNLQESNTKVQKETANLEKESVQIDIDNKLEEVKKVNALISKNGEVRSTVTGVISKSEIRKGLNLTGTEKIVISVKGFELSMIKQKDEMKQFAVGDEISITTASDEGPIISKIERIQKPDQKGDITFTALLPEGNYSLGSSMDYTVTKDSKEYSMCLPVNAVRQDSNDAFVLVVRDKSSILGKEQIAFAVSVHVISQDSKNVAVEGSLLEDDPIIISSNKNIGKGDRIRIDESDE